MQTIETSGLFSSPSGTTARHAISRAHNPSAGGAHPGYPGGNASAHTRGDADGDGRARGTGDGAARVHALPAGGSERRVQDSIRALPHLRHHLVLGDESDADLARRQTGAEEV